MKTRAAILCGLLLLLAGCSSAGDYAVKRLLDLSDIIDFKVGAGVGAGARASITDWFQPALALGAIDSGALYGRQVASSPPHVVQLLVVGADFHFPEGPSNLFILGARFREDEPDLPLVDRFRVGGEIWAIVDFGVYVNFGEIVDFVTGFFGVDVACDDDLMKGSQLTMPRICPEDLETEPPTEPVEVESARP